MKLFGTEITESEHRYIDDIIKDVWTKKYFLGFMVSRDCVTTKTKIPPITSIERKTATMGKITLETGMRVIVRSNEPDPLMISKIIGFNDFGGKVGGGGGAFPVIIDEAYGKEYTAMGIVLPYSEKLMNELKDLKPIEQWNYLVGEHGQIKEKYGIEYRTFK